ncbi:MAG: alanine racemase [Cycloclasticus sp.]
MSLGTSVVIDLAALRHNFILAARAAPNSKLMAVIKANAYGHGILEVAAALDAADGFAVARLDEAIRLRDAGSDKTILVLTGFNDERELREFSYYDLDAVVHSEYQVELLEACTGISPISVWLKINTGMNRLGIEAADLSRIADRIQLSAKVRLPYKLMTHFSCADDMASDVTQQQINLFDESVAGHAGEQSLANSAGLLGWQYAQRHWVRPGIMLYGGSPFYARKASDDQLKPVMTFSSRVISLRQLTKGQCVGYGASWVAPSACLIATIGAGYGDGYPRHAKTGTPVLINGVQVPVVGRVSMDSMTVDVSQCVGIKLGDKAVLWGEGLPIEQVAADSSTISYELMCGITERVKRIYRSAGNGE